MCIRDRENIPKLMDMVDKFAPDGWYEAQRNMIRKVIQELSLIHI